MVDLKPFVVAGLALGSVYALSGLGLVVLYRATGVLNLAYGAIGAAAAMIAWQLVDRGWPTAAADGVGLATAVLLSLGYGAVVAPSLARKEGTVKATSTLGFALALLGLMLIAWRDDPRSTSLPTDDTGVQLLGVHVTATQIACLGLAVLLTVGISAALQRTRVGRAMRAMACDRDLTSLLGVQVRAVEAVAWGLSGLLAGITGVLLADLVATEPTTLTFLVIPALAAATIGRFRSVAVTLAGGLGVGVLQSIATPYASVTEYRNAVPFLVAIVVLVTLPRRALVSGRAS